MLEKNKEGKIRLPFPCVLGVKAWPVGEQHYKKDYMSEK